MFTPEVLPEPLAQVLSQVREWSAQELVERWLLTVLDDASWLGSRPAAAGGRRRRGHIHDA